MAISARLTPMARWRPPGPLPNRFNRATLLGCLGIACVMALPLLLFLPLDEWSVPGWLALLAPLAGIAGLAVGAGLLMRVPSGGAPARNPFAPLTAAGAPPLVERPATAANRAGAAIALALFAVALLASSSLLAAPSSNGSCCPRCSRSGCAARPSSPMERLSARDASRRPRSTGYASPYAARFAPPRRSCWSASRRSPGCCWWPPTPATGGLHAAWGCWSSVESWPPRCASCATQ